MNRSRWIKTLLPLNISVGLLLWLLWSISPQALMDAATELAWMPMLIASVAMVLALYFWDAVCIPIVYRVEDHRWSYLQSLHWRGLSYLGGAINYELGQAALAWGMAHLQGTSLLRMLSRSVLLAYHDVVVLLGLGFAGSLLSSDPRVEKIRPFIVWGLVGAFAVGVLFRFLPASIREKFRCGEQQSFLEGWSVGRSMKLILFRVLYFGILIIYAAVALSICRISVDHQVVLTTVPLVLLADGLPSVAGLGTRDTMLQLLLEPEHPEVLFALSLIWTSAVVIVRIIIGLLHLWAHRLLGQKLPQGSPGSESASSHSL